MPRGDGTGPNGMGPMTGWGAGFCAAPAATGRGSAWPGRLGLGRGSAWRRMFYATGLPFWARGVPAGVTADQQRDILKNQADQLNEELDAIHRRIDELDSK